MKNNFLTIAGTTALIIAVLGLGSCTKDLNRFPTNSITANQAFSTPAGYKQALAKVYGAFALTSSNGPGASDLGGIDAGTSDFLRMYWNAQELSTGEAVCAWNDPGVPDFHNMNWNSSNVILMGLYSRLMYGVTVCNSFIRQCVPSVVAGHGISGKDAANIAEYSAEARFLRAYQYWALMDLFGNPPFVTDKDPIGTNFLPKQIGKDSLFTYIQSELLSIQTLLAAPHQNEYGRVDEAADWALLARLYLNAQAYTGAARYTDAITYSQKVINAGYSLMPVYQDLFLADNNLNNTEVIFPINYDGIYTQNYGGTTFLVNSSVGSDSAAAFGVPSGGWAGNRSTTGLTNLFPNPYGAPDHRALFYGNDATISSIADFTQGLTVGKFKNITATGALPPGAGTFCSVDFPLFRLAEQYLIYAEAVLRGGQGGDINTAVNYINLLRERAYGNNSGDITTNDLTLPFILDERGRELYWECFRRTDLIRFGDFTSGSYLWPWKGGVPSGTGAQSYRNLYPIPAADLQANSNLKQNSGY
ncbi:MAG: RagB/SusD family nutrient uptake outer membrane protein [Chitinophagaceae bacterium]|jgi:hypothetical protein|nr:MAG: RagB/SusD family nutrient uptake outer membrane protein [Chitinophagaceae bacterium]